MLKLTFFLVLLVTSVSLAQNDTSKVTTISGGMIFGIKLHSGSGIIPSNSVIVSLHHNSFGFTFFTSHRNESFLNQNIVGFGLNYYKTIEHDFTFYFGFGFYNESFRIEGQEINTYTGWEIDNYLFGNLGLQLKFKPIVFDFGFNYPFGVIFQMGIAIE